MTTPQTIMPLEELIPDLEWLANRLETDIDASPSETARAIRSALHHLEAGKRVVQCDGRTFNSPLDASLHLLWLLQRLSYYEPEREGMPCDGSRFRTGIIEARKLLAALDYENTIQKNPAPSTTPTVEVQG